MPPRAPKGAGESVRRLLEEHHLYARCGQKWGHIGQGVIVYNTTEIESTLC